MRSCVLQIYWNAEIKAYLSNTLPWTFENVKVETTIGQRKTLLNSCYENKQPMHHNTMIDGRKQQRIFLRIRDLERIGHKIETKCKAVYPNPEYTKFPDYLIGPI